MSSGLVGEGRKQQSKKLLFLSSPGDMAEERRIVAEEVSAINDESSSADGPEVSLRAWPNDFGAGAGLYPQSVINQQCNEYDIFVGLMGCRLGTPTPSAWSGTEEEFDRALEMLRSGHPVVILLFFSNRPRPIGEIDPYQLLLVSYFKSKVERLGLLAHTFSDLESFRVLFRKSLQSALSDTGGLWSSGSGLARLSQEGQRREAIGLGTLPLRANRSSPQWADYFLVPMAPRRQAQIQIEGLLKVSSPYFRFGFKYGDAREAVISAGSIQTFGQNVLVHLGRNRKNGPLFVTAYQSGQRLGPDRPIRGVDLVHPIPISFEVSRDGKVALEIGGSRVFERAFAIDAMPRILMMAWGDEHEFECELLNCLVTIEG